MFGIGMPELILIAIVALIVLGPNKLPDLAKSLGRAVREFRKATAEMKESFRLDGELNEAKKVMEEFHTEVNQAIRREALKPEEAGGPASAAIPEAPPARPQPANPPEEPSSEQKLEELKKAFEAWSAAKTEPPPPGAAPPANEPRRGA